MYVNEHSSSVLTSYWLEEWWDQCPGQVASSGLLKDTGAARKDENENYFFGGQPNLMRDVTNAEIWLPCKSFPDLAQDLFVIL
jgi:hypothetical protein